MPGVFAEFETNLRRERQAEGIAAAKTRGKYRGRISKINMHEIHAKLAKAQHNINRSGLFLRRDMVPFYSAIDNKAKAQMLSENKVTEVLSS